MSNTFVQVNSIGEQNGLGPRLVRPWTKPKYIMCSLLPCNTTFPCLQHNKHRQRSSTMAPNGQLPRLIYSLRSRPNNTQNADNINNLGGGAGGGLTGNTQATGLNPIVPSTGSVNNHPSPAPTVPSIVPLPTLPPNTTVAATLPQITAGANGRIISQRIMRDWPYAWIATARNNKESNPHMCRPCARQKKGAVNECFGGPWCLRCRRVGNSKHQCQNAPEFRGPQDRPDKGPPKNNQRGGRGGGGAGAGGITA
ncbi:uncharacterized protein LY89DRAFT_718875 [Mollisia scopiformis]|uniref:Uncharacterized protein n=1 Tax=Mollisia scopiformis TaxID=149040 RepID=A0A194XAN2_MOLSC|nr:uncharacterized protein LY89DRAFT_718875 [Mollisia scopiformis]KUJ17230.1 hypothetical protein LY89DRAFT_718875 [Mollisia scopiformis]